MKTFVFADGILYECSCPERIRFVGYVHICQMKCSVLAVPVRYVEIRCSKIVYGNDVTDERRVADVISARLCRNETELNICLKLIRSCVVW